MIDQSSCSRLAAGSPAAVSSGVMLFDWNRCNPKSKKVRLEKVLPPDRGSMLNRTPPSSCSAEITLWSTWTSSKFPSDTHTAEAEFTVHAETDIPST